MTASYIIYCLLDKVSSLEAMSVLVQAGDDSLLLLGHTRHHHSLGLVPINVHHGEGSTKVIENLNTREIN